MPRPKRLIYYPNDKHTYLDADRPTSWVDEIHCVCKVGWCTTHNFPILIPFAGQPTCSMAMEACCTINYLGLAYRRADSTCWVLGEDILEEVDRNDISADWLYYILHARSKYVRHEIDASNKTYKFQACDTGHEFHATECLNDLQDEHHQDEDPEDEP